MSGELLMEAMAYLPDEMLEKTDKLRRRQPIRWQAWAATAACLCLLLGIGYGFLGPGADKVANDCGGTPENMLADDAEDGITSNSTSASWLAATVESVEEGYVMVTLLSGQQAKVLLTEIDQAPSLEPGQKIRIYLKEIPLDTQILTPYKIALEEE